MDIFSTDDEFLNHENYLDDFNDDHFNDDPNFNSILDDLSFNQIYDDDYDKNLEFSKEILPHELSVQCKVEPIAHFSQTNYGLLKSEPSISSECNTDESSQPSSVNSSPMGRLVKKRDYPNITSSSRENSPQTIDENVPLPPKIIKEESVTPLPRQLLKLSFNQKPEPQINRTQIYISNPQNVVQIHKGVTQLSPYNVRKIPNCNIRAHKINQPTNTTQLKPISNDYVTNGLEKSYIIRSVSNTNQNSGGVTSFENYNNNNNYINNQHNSNNYAGSENSPLSDYERDINGDYYSNNKPMRYNTNSVINKNNNSNNTVFQHPIPTSGQLILTDEEKRTLLSEGFSVPTRLPLTKNEERNLKKVRRKIKNKISAQESRRKKKEYVDALEKKVEQLEQERGEYKRKCDQYENTQRHLQTQIRQLQQQLVTRSPTNTTSSSTTSSNTTSSTSSSTGLMVFMFCFMLMICGGGGGNFTIGGWGYRAQMRLPTSALMDTGGVNSFYRMGYLQNNHTNLYHHHHLPNNQDLHHQHHFHKHSHNHNNQQYSSKFNSDTEQQHHQRPSILMGDDSGDDLSFEEWIKTYRLGFICNRKSTNNYSNKSTTNSNVRNSELVSIETIMTRKSSNNSKPIIAIIANTIDDSTVSLSTEQLPIVTSDLYEIYYKYLQVTK